MEHLKCILQKFDQIANHPESQLKGYLNAGKQVVGCFPPFAPEVLVHACGMIPMGLWGGKKPIKLARAYLPAFACPLMQSCMEQGLDGTYQGLSAVIIPSLCDTLRCMTQNWKSGVPDIPVIPITYPQNNQSAGCIGFLLDELEHVRRELEDISGRKITIEQLEDSIAVYNAHIDAMMQFSEVANLHLNIITPRIRHNVMKSALYTEKAEHTELLWTLIDALNAQSECIWNHGKVILTGIRSEPDYLLDLLQENNIAVVGDDLVQESQQYRVKFPDGSDPMERIVAQWRLRRGCSLIHEDTRCRAEVLKQMAQDNDAGGLIACMEKFCDPEEYEFPIYKAQLKKTCRILSVEMDQQRAGDEQLRTMIETFSALL